MAAGILEDDNDDLLLTDIGGVAPIETSETEREGLYERVKEIIAEEGMDIDAGIIGDEVLDELYVFSQQPVDTIIMDREDARRLNSDSSPYSSEFTDDEMTQVVDELREWLEERESLASADES